MDLVALLLTLDDALDLVEGAEGALEGAEVVDGTLLGRVVALLPALPTASAHGQLRWPKHPGAVSQPRQRDGGAGRGRTRSGCPGRRACP